MTLIPLRTAVLISGKGSNLAALVEAAKTPGYPAEIALVISNKPEAGGLKIAAEAGIPSRIIPHTEYESRDEFEAAIQAALESHRIQLVCLAGFMRVLGAEFVAQWPGRMLNIHPSLLPAYKGLNTHARALEAGEKEAGCTMHLVVPELDSGPILAQARVPVLPGDTPETLAARVQTEEHRIYPQALGTLAQKLLLYGGGGE
jgi:phosphoribosylglycinamide formyltransferase 1